ncbi:MAG: AAA family ATPase [Chloroflexaceae bacterium]|nr:AAA family ATPase [Chloroflexaceae bacterium]
MRPVSGYRIREHLYESSNSQVYRALRLSDATPVILKMLKETFPSPERIAWFRREYEVTRSLNLPGIPLVYGLETDRDRWLMVLEDFGGESLTRLGLAGRLRLPAFLSLATEITEILGQIHQRHTMHKDLNPSNIVFNPTTNRVKIIDFGISTVLSREKPTFRNPHVLEGTLVYMSPEQTGRMNRAMDYRTDFYSLGATFYELLTGQVPFDSDDALSLVHHHLARQPLPPHERSPSIPEELSLIILKLMAKNAEDRYQSAYGLKADLEIIRELVIAHAGPDGIVGGGEEERPPILRPEFVPGQHDTSDRFLIPQKLYGREREIAALLDAFERLVQGASEVVLLAGAAGVGKTALVQELYEPLTRQRGYVISGRFEPLQQDIPYAALIQAFRSLVQYVLIASDRELAGWRTRLLAAVGPNGRVLTDVIPEVEHIIGPQPEIPVLGPKETQNRFNLVFEQFVRIFTRPEHPLVLFLDDMQWADSASFALLEQMMTAPDHQNLLLIGAYRDGEVGAYHPFWATIEAIRQAGVRVSTLALTPLDIVAVTRLVAETLHCAEEPAMLLAGLVVSKTGGNPFFLQEFLTSLYSEALIDFDYTHGCWHWNLEQIEAQEITDNVVDLLTRKVQRLAATTQDVLKLAACIGNQFDLVKLAVVSQKPVSRTAHDLDQAVMEGVVVPLGDTYKLMMLDVPGLSDAVSVEYMFAHSRVYQAVYSLMPDEERQLAHWCIGNLLLLDIQPPKREERIFDIVHQLNQGRALIADQSEREEVVRLNLLAGKRARSSAAFVPSFHYLSMAIELLEGEGSHPADHWQAHYALCLEVYTEATEASYLTGDFQSMERLSRTVLDHSRTVLDTVTTYEVKIRAYVAQGRQMEAVQTALSVLELLDIHFREKPDQTDTLDGLQETRSALEGKTFEDLMAMPEITDPARLAAMRILTSVMNAAYLTTPELMSLITFKMVSLSVRHGYTPISAHAYASYGLILCGDIGDIDAGYRFGQLALHLLDRFDARALRPRTLMVVNTFIRHWKEHARETLPALREAHRIGMEIGDFEFAAIAAHVSLSLSLFIGTPLEELEQDMAESHEVLSRVRQQRSLAMHGLYWQVVLNLLGRSADPAALLGERYHEERMLPRHLAAKDKTAVYYVHFNKLVLCYLFRHYAEAVEHATSAEACARSAMASFSIALLCFYDSLARLAVLREREPHAQDPGDQEQPLDGSHLKFDLHYLEKVAANQEKLKQWARHAPMNHRHRWCLVEAECSRMVHADKDARDYYDQAIDLAREYGYVHDEALACELAASFYFNRKRPRIAHAYLQDAYYAYQRWGAQAKVSDLEERFPEFFSTDDPSAATRERTRITTSVTRTEEREASVLDIVSIIKTSQAIFGEIVLEPLLTRLMHIFIENAGAERGVLLLPHTGQWVVEAEYHIDRDPSPVLQSIPLSAAALPATIIHYAGHMQESVVLHDANCQPAFAQDPYLQTRHPRSILCMPMIYQGELIGILYLENNLTAEAFTEDRVEVLHLLASQAAISIVHARLYRHMEDIVETRTAELSYTNQVLHGEIAERKRTEQALYQAKEAAEAANRAKSTFLANMSHELRTPLNTILGFAQLMDRSPDLLPEHRDYLGIIHRSGRHLLNLINEVLDLSRVEAGRLTLNEMPFDLLRLLNDLEEMFRVRAREKHLRLHVEGASDVPRYICSDESRLRQVLINLLSNAVKFTQEGQVTLRVSDWGVLPRRPQDRMDEPGHPDPDLRTLVFEVTDTGPGVAPEELDSMFEAFVQARAGQQAREGTGLGLPISRKIVNLMGGDIMVRSEVGRGSVFTFEVRVRVVDASEVPPRPETHATVRTDPAPHQPVRRVLIVDDQEDNRQLLVKLLLPLGVELREAGSGQEALNIWEHWSPHLIWMDMRMPGLDGYEATRHIKATARGQATVIIALTAGVFEEERARALLAGCDDFICKPFQDTDIFDTMCRHLGICFDYVNGDPMDALPRPEIAPLTADALASLPAEWVANLHRAAILGDIGMLSGLVDEVSHTQADLAATLRSILHGFQFEQIIQVAEQLLPE